MEKNNKLVGLYIRVATDKQDKSESSLELQREECIKSAYKLYGNDITLIPYVDENKSAELTMDRYGLHRMIHDVRGENLDAIITYDVSRISRTLVEFLTIIYEIQKSKIEFITVKESV